VLLVVQFGMEEIRHVGTDVFKRAQERSFHFSNKVLETPYGDVEE
jgi:hypothetical protein